MDVLGILAVLILVMVILVKVIMFISSRIGDEDISSIIYQEDKELIDD